MKIIIEGTPISQIRMKFSGRNGIGRVYDPREKQKREIKAIIKSKFVEQTQFQHPRVSFVFLMPIPKSTPKKELQLYNSGLLKHEKKPDVDNIVKLYLDCMDTILFDGDQKVVLGTCVKLYHPSPKTIILIEEMTSILKPNEIDPLTFLGLFSKEVGQSSSGETAYLPDSYNPFQLTNLQLQNN